MSCEYLNISYFDKIIKLKWMVLTCHLPNVWLGFIKEGGGALQLTRQMPSCGRGTLFTINADTMIQSLGLVELVH